MVGPSVKLELGKFMHQSGIEARLAEARGTVSAFGNLLFFQKVTSSELTLGAGRLGDNTPETR